MKQWKCSRCGKVIGSPWRPSPSGRNYCNNACRQADYRARKAAAILAKQRVTRQKQTGKKSKGAKKARQK